MATPSTSWVATSHTNATPPPPRALQRHIWPAAVLLQMLLPEPPLTSHRELLALREAWVNTNFQNFVMSKSVSYQMVSSLGVAVSARGDVVLGGAHTAATSPTLEGHPQWRVWWRGARAWRRSIDRGCRRTAHGPCMHRKERCELGRRVWCWRLVSCDACVCACDRVPTTVHGRLASHHPLTLVRSGARAGK